MTELVKIRNNIVSCTSREIGEAFWKEHKDILKALRNLECSEKFSQRNFTPSKYKIRWKEYTEYIITEKWFSFLVMWFTWKKASEFKEKYIEAFDKLTKIVNWLNIHKISDIYKQARLEWKVKRRDFTDVLKELELYALEQNPNANTKFIYSNYTKVINKNLFIVEWKFKNVRDYCDTDQLTTLKNLENNLTNIIIKEIDNSTPYKDIYYIIKEKMEAYNGLFDKTKVISTNIIKEN